MPLHQLRIIGSYWAGFPHMAIVSFAKQRQSQTVIIG
jgi:hypothetical protein